MDEPNPGAMLSRCAANAPRRTRHKLVVRSASDVALFGKGYTEQLGDGMEAGLAVAKRVH